MLLRRSSLFQKFDPESDGEGVPLIVISKPSPMIRMDAVAEIKTYSEESSFNEEEYFNNQCESMAEKK